MEGYFYLRNSLLLECCHFFCEWSEGEIGLPSLGNETWITLSHATFAEVNGGISPNAHLPHQAVYRLFNFFACYKFVGLARNLKIERR